MPHIPPTILLPESGISLKSPAGRRFAVGARSSDAPLGEVLSKVTRVRGGTTAHTASQLSSICSGQVAETSKGHAQGIDVKLWWPNIHQSGG